MRARIWSVTAIFLLAGCGGDGNDGESSLSAAPSNLSYPSPQVFAVSQPITTINPTVTGTVTNYSVSPALPAGLTMDATTGTISGTPTTVAAAATYTVTASNASGSTTAGISMTVNDTAPSISYGSSSYTFTTGVPAPAIMPAHSGGAVASWSIDQPLPAGLTFNTTDGSISGTATTTSAAANYVVTALNSGGSDTFELSIAVDSGVLLDLGHAREIVAIRRKGNRVLSIDFSGHWVLWDRANAEMLVQGDVTCLVGTIVDGDSCGEYVDLAGSTLAVRTSTGLQVRDAADGQVLASIPTSASWWKLASDGSYVAAGTASEVTTWTRTGTLLFSRPGNYASGRAFAAPSELRIAASAAGADMLERIAISNAASTTSQFQGAFHSWFLEGDRFLTTVSTTVWVYATDGIQQDLRVLPSFDTLVGQGEYFWIEQRSPHELVIYPVGASASPAASFALPASTALKPSELTIGLLSYGASSVGIVDLSSATPAKSDYTQPLVYSSAYGASTGGEWYMGDGSGVLVAVTAAVPATPRYFGFGAASSIAASETRIAVATATGTILYFDAATRELEGTIQFDSSKLQLSADGTVLAAKATDRYAQYRTDRSLRIYSLPSETIIRDEPYDLGTVPWPADFSLSTSGQVFGRVLSTSTTGTYDRQVYAAAGGAQPLLWSDTVSPSMGMEPPPIHLSPDGSRIAVANDGQTVNTGTSIYSGSTLTSAVAGMAVGWIDNDRLLVNRYVMPSFTRYENSAIVNAAGQQLLTLPLRNITRFQTIAADRIYSPELNAIFSLTDGQTLWESASPALRVGAVTPTHAIFASGATVRAEPY